jgi:hypothetical protein
MHEQDREQHPLASTTQSDGLAVTDGLERPKHAELRAHMLFVAPVSA